MKIIAEDGKIFKRIHDNVLMGNEISLGVDFSTGKPRDDKEEYYVQIDKPEKKEFIPKSFLGNKNTTSTTTIVKDISSNNVEL